MGEQYTTKSFKSGNSVAIRVPAALGVEPGQEWLIDKDENGALVIRPKAVAKRRINLDKIWGSIPGLELLKPEDRVLEERSLVWDDPEWRAKNMPDA